jgi:hypothetical protein
MRKMNATFFGQTRNAPVGEPHASEDVEHAWDLEIRDRIARYDRGESRSRPAGDVNFISMQQITSWVRFLTLVNRFY